MSVPGVDRNAVTKETQNIARNAACGMEGSVSVDSNPRPLPSQTFGRWQAANIPTARRERASDQTEILVSHGIVDPDDCSRDCGRVADHAL
jgi:hypothetical protein